MTVHNSQGQPYSNRFDYNKDGQINHTDVEAYIHDMDAGEIKGNARFLLNLQKAGGEVTAKDWMEFMDEGGKLDGSDILKFVNAGGTLNQQELAALRAAGVDFTPKELAKIETKFGIPHTSRFPAGTTPADLLKMAESGVKITADDLISLKAADGTSPAFVDIKDLIKLEELGCHVTGEDLIAFQKTGGNFNGDHLVDFVNAGGDINAAELVTLAKGGVQIWQDDLQHITGELGIRLTAEQFMAINPVKGDDSPVTDNYAPGFTM